MYSSHTRASFNIIWKLEKELHTRVHKPERGHTDPGVHRAAAPSRGPWRRGPRRRRAAVLHFPTSRSMSCLPPAPPANVTESLDPPPDQVHESRKGVVVFLAQPPGPRAEQLRDCRGSQTGPALRLHVKAGGIHCKGDSSGHTPFIQRSQGLTHTLIKSQVST